MTLMSQKPHHLHKSDPVNHYRLDINGLDTNVLDYIGFDCDSIIA